jgi:hypothetical protein
MAYTYVIVRESRETSQRRAEMNKSEARRVAIGAVRSELRRHKENPVIVSALDAEKVLDDIARQDSQLIASIWYREASDAQIKLFRREWNVWTKEN